MASSRSKGVGGCAPARRSVRARWNRFPLGGSDKAPRNIGLRAFSRVAARTRGTRQLCRAGDPRHPGATSGYLRYITLRKRGHSIHGNIQSIADMMRALAPEADWGWVKRAAGRLRASTVPARDKRSRLRPIEELVAEGYQMMARAENDTSMSTLGRAALFRDGLRRGGREPACDRQGAKCRRRARAGRSAVARHHDPRPIRPRYWCSQ